MTDEEYTFRAAAPETGEKLTSAVRALIEKIGGAL